MEGVVGKGSPAAVDQEDKNRGGMDKVDSGDSKSPTWLKQRTCSEELQGIKFIDFSITLNFYYVPTMCSRHGEYNNIHYVVLITNNLRSSGQDKQ